MTGIAQLFHTPPAQSDATPAPLEEPDQDIPLDWKTLPLIAFAGFIMLTLVISTIVAFALSISAFAAG